eukprot:6108942-Amphidinium_carterae.3
MEKRSTSLFTAQARYLCAYYGTACHTWRHARYWTTGKGAQIDHICACRFLTSKVRRSFIIGSTQLATTVVSDHDLVSCELGWLRRPQPRTEASGKFMNAEHRQDFKQAYATQPTGLASESIHPFQAYQQWLMGVQALVSSTVPQLKRAAKKDWMTTRTWELITHTASLAKRMVANHHRLSKATLAQAFYCWKWSYAPTCSYSNYAAMDTCGAWRHTFNWCAVLRVRHRCARSVVRSACRLDKKRWVQVKCEDLKECYEDQRNQYHQLLKGLRRWQPTARPNYAMEGGTLASTTAELHEAWTAHWLGKLGGVTPHVDNSYLRFDRYTPVGPERNPHRDLKPIDEDEVKDALATFKYGKASADVVHGPCPVFNNVLATSQVPACWRGASVCAVPKPKEPTSCRPISLLVHSQRVFTRVLLARLRGVLCVDANQLALSKVGGCEQAHVMVASVDCWARRHRMSVSHLHVDLKSAFDVIVRQLLVGPHKEPDAVDDTDNADDMTLAQLCNVASFFERHTLPLLE